MAECDFSHKITNKQTKNISRLLALTAESVQCELSTVILPAASQGVASAMCFQVLHQECSISNSCIMAHLPQGLFHFV